MLHPSNSPWVRARPPNRELRWLGKLRLVLRRTENFMSLHHLAPPRCYVNRGLAEQSFLQWPQPGMSYRSAPSFYTLSKGYHLRTAMFEEQFVLSASVF